MLSGFLLGAFFQNWPGIGFLIRSSRASFPVTSGNVFGPGINSPDGKSGPCKNPSPGKNSGGRIGSPGVPGIGRGLSSPPLLGGETGGLLGVVGGVGAGWGGCVAWRVEVCVVWAGFSGVAWCTVVWVVWWCSVVWFVCWYGVLAWCGGMLAWCAVLV